MWVGIKSTAEPANTPKTEKCSNMISGFKTWKRWDYVLSSINLITVLLVRNKNQRVREAVLKVDGIKDTIDVF